MVAGGDESMSRQPFLDYGARAGWRLGSRESIDGTLSLLTDPFGGYQMGVTAEKVAERHDVSREQQDAFALLSQQRAADGDRAGPLRRPDRPDRGAAREGAVRRGRASAGRPRSSSSPSLRPVFQEGGSRDRRATPRASTTAPRP